MSKPSSTKFYSFNYTFIFTSSLYLFLSPHDIPPRLKNSSRRIEIEESREQNRALDRAFFRGKEQKDEALDWPLVVTSPPSLPHGKTFRKSRSTGNRHFDVHLDSAGNRRHCANQISGHFCVDREEKRKMNSWLANISSTRGIRHRHANSLEIVRIESMSSDELSK